MGKPYAVFYHVWCPPDLSICRLVVDEQLKRMYRAGLPNGAEVFCCVSGRHHEAVADLVGSYDWTSLAISTADESRFEGLTLERLFDHCVACHDLHGVAYVHTKGISALSWPGTANYTFRSVNSWRHFLEWGTIDRWRDAVLRLAEYDAVGVNYRTDPWPHFSGNFWWARPDYIRRLIRPTLGSFPAGDFSFVQQTGDDRRRVIERLDFERWLGLSNPRAFSFYGFPFTAGGTLLPHDFYDLYQHDIEPYYRLNGI